MCKRWFENLDTDITNFVQSSDRNKKSINNYNESSDADCDSNSDYELLEPYISDENYPHTIERGNHTNHKNNIILDDDNIENFSTETFDIDITIYDDDDVGNNQRRINDD